MTGGGSQRPCAQLVCDLQNRLGYQFNDLALFKEALTHSSFPGNRVCNERLEFLGDRVLGLIVASLLFRRFANEEVGALARRHAALVSRDALAHIAGEIHLAPAIRLSRGEDEAGGRQNPALLADACEAVIAAVFLDGGFEAVRGVVEALWAPLVERDATPPKDPKTLLQEWAQGRGRPLPIYRETARSGPPHAPTFCVEVVVEGCSPVAASGPSRRSAERAAAESLLAQVLATHGS